MQCPKCKNIKQLIPYSKRTETSVYRRRICKSCNHIWITVEQISEIKTMPTETSRFVDKFMRHGSKGKWEKVAKDTKFDTTALRDIKW